MKSNMKRLLALILVCAMAMAMLTGCGKKEENQPENTPSESQTNQDDGDQTPEPKVEDEEKEKLDINVAALKGPTIMGMVKLMKDSDDGTTANNYNVTVAGAADEVTAGLMKGDISIAAIPSNLASVLYNKSEGKVKVAAINTLGVLYILETGDSIQSVEDLKGKTIYTTGKGTTPEYTLNYLLTSYGLDPEKDVTIEFKSEAAEVVSLLAGTENAIAMLPQPQVTIAMSQNEKLRVALDVTKEWEAKAENGSTITTGVIAVNAKFLEEHPEAVEQFLTEYEASAKYANENIDETAALLEQYDIFKAGVAKKAIPMCNITFIRGDEMKTKLNGYLEVLFEQNPQAVGGKLPADDFYLK
ncbi:ABC transporter substrate-binding protein [Anaerolentibacter hominis]|uniref:ABC transporter substrate-binding protein n=1 Tax=Anaerolentibacter hominis TaxID=3079009 RepID=UPI0031B89C04